MKLSEFARYAKLNGFRIDRSRLGGVVTLLGTLVLTLSVVGTVYANVNRLHAAFEWVRHTDQVILQIVNVEKNLLAADSTTRAQVHSGIIPKEVNAGIANDSVKAQVKRLVSLVGDNPEQLRRALHLQATIADRAKAPIDHEGAEFRRMSAIRVEILEMLDEEGKLLQIRTASEERATTVSLIFASLLALLALVLGGLGSIYLLSRERARRRNVELELMRIQRLNMMSLTTMALAHEINQPLAAAGNYLACSLRLANTADAIAPVKMVDFSMRAKVQVLRAGKIIKRLCGFVEKSNGERTIEDPSVIIDDAISLFGTIDYSIKIETRIDSNLSPVFVDRIQLQQVLINLIRNSIEALDGGKRIKLILSAVAVDSKHVRFSVQDNGPGLPKKVQEDLFKPFETTKSGGLGAGLMICKAIIAAHGGYISGSSGPEGGTIISFTLPALSRQLAA